MKHLKIEKYLKIEEIQERVQNSESKEAYRRWQAILMISTLRLNASTIASVLGVATTTIYKWVQIYNLEGAAAYNYKGAGGRRHSLLSIAEEKAILNKLSELSEAGLFINVTKIRKNIEEKVNQKVSKNYVYDLLHRHNWHKIVPRPSHPKKDKEKQEEYKKNCRNLWMKQ